MEDGSGDEMEDGGSDEMVTKFNLYLYRLDILHNRHIGRYCTQSPIDIA